MPGPSRFAALAPGIARACAPLAKSPARTAGSRSRVPAAWGGAGAALRATQAPAASRERLTSQNGYGHIQTHTDTQTLTMYCSRNFYIALTLLGCSLGQRIWRSHQQTQE